MPPSSRQALVQVFNLRAIAIVFYLCLGMALSRALGWYMPETPVSEWLHSAVRFTRQSLTTGLSLLLAVALVEAWLARPGAAPGRHIPLRALAVFLGAALGTVARHLLVRLSEGNVHWKWGWALSTCLLWTLLGGVAYSLWQTARAERQARQQLQEAARSHEALQAQQLQAQLSALNAQIEPHFLFNTLANVKRLYETAPERGRDMLLSLIAYLRAALPSMRRGDSTLGQELELVRNYLSILQMRMGDRLRFDIQAEPRLLDARLPPMVLPTLVENAIKHGLSPLPEGGDIRILARCQEAQMLLEVHDNGQGFAASGGSGVGLSNTRARLAALFGPSASLELEAAQPRGVVARLRLPLSEVAA